MKLENKLSNEERELVLIRSADNRQEWSVWTDDPVSFNQLVKKGHTPSWTDGKTAIFVIDDRWVTIRRRKE